MNNVARNAITAGRIPKSDDRIWDDMTETWEETTLLWDEKERLTNTAKNAITPGIISKS